MLFRTAPFPIQKPKTNYNAIAAPVSPASSAASAAARCLTSGSCEYGDSYWIPL